MELVTEEYTIRCDCCGMSSIHLHGGTLAGLEAVATQSGWTSRLGLWACVLCSQTGRTPPGFDSPGRH